MRENLNFDPVSEDIPKIDSEYPPGVRSVIFTSEEKKLLGTILTANGKGPNPAVLLLHGFPGNENNFDLAQSIRRAGYTVVFFHYRGLWGSEGNFSFSNALKDTENVITQLMEMPPKNDFRLDPSDITLIGHSMGGWLAMMNGRNFPEIKRIAFLAGFNFGYFASLMLNNDEFIEITKQSLVESENYLGTCKADILYDEMIRNMTEWDLTTYSEALSKKDILMAGARLDEMAPVPFHHVPLLNSLQTQGIKSLKETIINSGHSFSGKRIELQKLAIDWLLRRENENAE